FARDRKEKTRRSGAAHSMRDSAQVTAPGAVTSMIVAVSTRPNRQNRSRCSRMSVPLVQNQMLRLVDRFGRRSRRSQIAAYPRQDRQDGHRHPEDKYEPSWFWFWFRCHGTPPGATLFPVPVPVLVPAAGL